MPSTEVQPPGPQSRVEKSIEQSWKREWGDTQYSPFDQRGPPFSKYQQRLSGSKTSLVYGKMYQVAFLDLILFNSFLTSVSSKLTLFCYQPAAGSFMSTQENIQIFLHSRRSHFSARSLTEWLISWALKPDSLVPIFARSHSSHGTRDQQLVVGFKGRI